MLRRLAARMILTAGVASFAFVACTGGAPPTDSTEIVALRVSPANPIVAVGAPLTFILTAYQVDGEAKVITDKPGVSWKSSNVSVVNINSDGTGTALVAGESLITASYGSLQSPAQNVTVGAGPTPTPTPTPAPTATNVLISEVMFNPGVEPTDQYVELHNPTAAPVVLTSWTLAYNSGSSIAFTFPAFTLNAGEYVVLANDPSHFSALNNPYPPVANIFQYVMANLSNTGDWFKLKNGGGTVVDEMAYGTGFDPPPAGGGTVRPVGWCGTNNPTAVNLFPVSRKPVNNDGSTCDDWIGSAAFSPGTATP